MAKGYSQVAGVDYNKTLSATANMTSEHSLMQLAVQHELELHQMDVKTAYLHAPIDCEVYMEHTEGFKVKAETGEKLVCKLIRSLYGLKQLGQNWNRMHHNFLNENVYIQNLADHCVHSEQTTNEMVVMIIWVDDLIIATNGNRIVKDVKEMLGATFKMKDLGELEHCLGIDFVQRKGEIKMSQKGTSQRSWRDLK